MPPPRCLLTGLFSQVAELQPGRTYLTLHSRDEAKIHPSSHLFESRSPYLLYTELINTGKHSIQSSCSFEIVMYRLQL